MRLTTWLIFVPFTLLWLVPTVFADTPVVCASGAGNVTVNNYNLVSQCGAPAGKPVYVELKMLSSFFNSGRVQLSEGSQSCDIYASANTWADCAVTVSDGVLDTASVSNSPQNYRLMARWGDATITDTQTAASVFTTTLTSGDVLVIRREYSYGDIAVGGIMFFGVAMLLVGMITNYVTGR